MTNVEEKLLVLPNPQNQKSTSKKSRKRHCICDSAPLPLLDRAKHQKFLMSSAKLANNHGQDCNDLCQVPTSTPQQQAPTQPLLQISKHKPTLVTEWTSNLKPKKFYERLDASAASIEKWLRHNLQLQVVRIPTVECANMWSNLYETWVHHFFFVSAVCTKVSSILPRHGAALEIRERAARKEKQSFCVLDQWSMFMCLGSMINCHDMERH